MLTLKTLAADLRQKTLASDLNEILRQCPRPLPSLSAIPSPPLLVRFFEEALLHSPERDRVVADLLLAARAMTDPNLSSILLYAFVPVIRRVVGRIRLTSNESLDEIIADVLAVAVEKIHRYDPDRRSIHIQANIELDIFNAFYRRWEAEKRTRETTSDISYLVRETQKNAFAQTAPSTLFPGLPKNQDPMTDDDLRLGEQVLRDISERGLLSEMDCDLMIEFRLRGNTSTAIGERHGIDRRTVVRRVQAACDSIRETVTELFSEPDARFDERVTIQG